MRPFVAVVAVLTLFPFQTHAQTVSMTADLAPLEASQRVRYMVPEQVDDDGDGFSDSWLLKTSRFAYIDYGDGSSEIVEVVRYALARGTGCVERWWSPVDEAHANHRTAIITRGKEGRRDVLRVQDGTKITTLRLDRQRCQ